MHTSIVTECINIMCVHDKLPQSKCGMFELQCIEIMLLNKQVNLSWPAVSYQLFRLYRPNSGLKF